MVKPCSGQYDVVILGGGIAGLLLASELSSRHKLLLLEKGAAAASTKYWLTDRESADVNPELVSAIDMRYEHLDFIAFDQSSYRCRGEYVLWNTERLTSHLRSKINVNGGLVVTDSRFYGYNLRPDRVTIMANSESYDARLAIDCMGYGSPIIYAQGVVDILGYYLLYGATLPLARPLDPVGLHNLILSKNPGYIEAFPTSTGTVHIILIQAVRDFRPVSVLRDDFNFIVKRSPYSQYLDVDGEREFLGGIIPTGRLKRRALDRIFFFGEAGQANPAATATALTRMLRNYKQTAQFLAERIDANQLSSRYLENAPAPTSRFNRNMQANLFKSILSWDSSAFSRIVREMTAANNDQLVNDIMFGDLPESKSVIAKTAFQLLRSGSRQILGHLAGGLRVT